MPCKGCPTEGKQQGWRTSGATTWEAEEIYSVLITLFPTSPWQAWFGWRPWNTSPCLSLFHESSCSRNPRHPFPDSPIAPALLPCASDEQQPGWAGDPMVNHPKAQEENDLTSRRWATTSNVESWFINLPIVKPLQSFSYLYIWGLKYDQWFYIRHGSCLWNWAPLLTTIVSKKSPVLLPSSWSDYILLPDRSHRVAACTWLRWRPKRHALRWPIESKCWQRPPNGRDLRDPGWDPGRFHSIWIPKKDIGYHWIESKASSFLLDRRLARPYGGLKIPKHKHA